MKICFDLDGTLADLYGVDGWLDDLTNGNPRPYIIAKPLVRMSHFAKLVNKLQRNGHELVIISWLARNSRPEYDEKVTAAKLEWLHKHLPSVDWDEIHIVSYGTPKYTLGDGYLFDDEEKNREEWEGIAYDVKNICEILKSLV